MTKRKTKNNFLQHFNKVWFSNDAEYMIFVVWGFFVCVFLIQFI